MPSETTNVYLFLNGIYEQIKVEDANVSGESISEKEWISNSSKSYETKKAWRSTLKQLRWKRNGNW